MAFSYGGPQTGPKDEVRFTLGDTDEKRPYLSDEEIDWLLLKANGRVSEAALRGCDRILIALTGLVDESVGEVSISFSQQLAAFERVHARLTRRANMAFAGPIVGGIDRAAKAAQARDANRVPPLFMRNGSEHRREDAYGTSGTDVGWPLGLGNIGSAYGDERGRG